MLTTILTQVCSRCGKDKPLKEFTMRKDRQGQRYTTCKDCVRLRNDAYNLTENGRASKRKYNVCPRGRRLNKTRTRNKEAAIRHTLRNNAKYPGKVVARRLVTQALKRGELIKANTCELCGSDDLIQMHHDDYAHPLSVMWLCRLCHDKKHGKMLDRQEFPDAKTASRT